jgi:hypothetical protein
MYPDMNESKIEVFLDGDRNVVFSLVRRADHEPLDVRFDRAALFDNGFAAAAGTLGGKLLLTLNIWDKAFLNGIDTGAAEAQAPPHTHLDAALDLIEQSVRLRSAQFVPAIDYLLSTAVNAPGSGDFAREDWPAIRQRLGEFAVPAADD